MAAIPWPSVVEERSDPEQDLVDALAALQESSDETSPAAVLQLARAHLAEVNHIRHAATPNYESLIKDKCEQAEQLVRDHMGECKTRWGQAVMQLALAEVQIEQLSAAEDCKLRDFDDAIENALAAQEAFQDPSDPAMEAQTWLVAADIRRREELATHCWRHDGQQPLNFGKQTFEALRHALDLFDEAGSVAGVARVRLILGVAHSYKLEFAAATADLEHSQEGFALAGNTLYEGIARLSQAQLIMRHNGHSRQLALQLSKEAMERFLACGRCGARVVEAHEAIVNAHIFRGELKESLQFAQQWVDTAEASDDPRQQSIALVSLAQAHFADQNDSEAMRVMDSAHLLVQDVRDPMLEHDILLKASQIHVLGREYDRGWALANEAVSLAQKHQKKRKEAAAIQILQQVHFYRILCGYRSFEQQEEIDTYKTLAEEQRVIWQELEEEGRATMVMLGKVGMLGTEGRFEEGKTLCEECQDAFVKTRDKYGEALALQFLTEFHSDLNCLEKAAKAARDMRRCAWLLRDDVLMSKAFQREHRVHRRFGSYKHAIVAVEKALDLAQRMRDDEAVVDYRITLAGSLMDSAMETPSRSQSLPGQIRRALGIAKTAYNLAKKLRPPRMALQATAAFCLGRVQFYAATAEDGTPSQLEAALKYATESILICKKEPGTTEQEAVATELVARIHRQSGNINKAVDAAQTLLELAQQCGDQDLLDAADDLLWHLEQQSGKKPAPSAVDQHGEQPYAGQQRRPRPPPRRRQEPDDAMGASETTSAQAKRVLTMPAPKAEAPDPFEAKEIIVDMVKRLTGTDPGETPLLEAPGLDSLAAVSFRNSLKEHFGIQLPPQVLYEYPTTKRLAMHVALEKFMQQQ